MSTPSADKAAGDPASPEEPEGNGPAGYEFVESLLLGPRTWTRSEVAHLAGVGTEHTARIWRALGFPAVADEDPAFTDADVEALRAGERLIRAGVITAESETMMARALAHHLSRLAEWQMHTLAAKITADGGDLVEESALTLLPELELLQRHVWRRHLAAHAARTLPRENASPDRHREDTRSSQVKPAGEFPVLRRAVGFTDMVGYTRMSRGLDGPELARMIDRFEELTSSLIAEGRGRVVKTIGDEVLFVADTADDAAGIALEIASRTKADPALPRLRTGLAHGAVLNRFGDVYGSTVNTAARLTALARPGTTLVDTELAAELAHLAAYSLRTLRPVSVRGYKRLRPVLLRPAGDRTG
ncbi:MULTISPECIES: adenylate/guanylate cyclase domain-containing protein [unclassified Streptomyces]|uniref:adenylate/guanylate cyclase domain-containing protein n=1 Tax=unclassified Streptomyces TaxID=2593676 RepID=UPI000978D238|nr:MULTISPECIES: adenylate/guanylate cyclase domain-containing protein [unclassified Streptomyces]ONI54265.1 pH-sensitive adenylate cyclase [Streptomyces sp. IB2014 011-1]